jgi:hypothetical protein
MEVEICFILVFFFLCLSKFCFDEIGNFECTEIDWLVHHIFMVLPTSDNSTTTRNNDNDSQSKHISLSHLLSLPPELRMLLFAYFCHVRVDIGAFPREMRFTLRLAENDVPQLPIKLTVYALGTSSQVYRPSSKLRDENEQLEDEAPVESLPMGANPNRVEKERKEVRGGEYDLRLPRSRNVQTLRVILHAHYNFAFFCVLASELEGHSIGRIALMCDELTHTTMMAKTSTLVWILILKVTNEKKFEGEGDAGDGMSDKDWEAYYRASLITHCQFPEVFEDMEYFEIERRRIALTVKVITSMERFYATNYTELFNIANYSDRFRI